MKGRAVVAYLKFFEEWLERANPFQLEVALRLEVAVKGWPFQ